MIILVVGKPDSGKSSRAEALAMELAGDGRLIYLATMEPYGEEGQKRIEKHRKLRQGKGFVTVEKTLDLAHLGAEGALEAFGISGGTTDSTCLLECVSNLVGNEMHVSGRESWSADKVAEYVLKEIGLFSAQVKNLVAVTNEFEVQQGFDSDTLKYVEITGLVNKGLEEMADKVIRVC